MVRFIVDYRGVLTKEEYFLAGDEHEFAPPVEKALVDEGRAEFVGRPEKSDGAEVAPEVTQKPPAKRGPGRPKGSRNRRKPGRPRGS